MSSAIADLRPPMQRTLLAQLARGVFSRAGARVGLAWVGTLVFLAIFAPLLANSHPLLMKSADGTISSPLIRHLTAADLTIFVAGIAAALVYFFKSWSLAKRLLAAAAIIGLAAALSYPLVQKRFAVPQIYRDGLAEGTITWAIHTPIPYSPDDRTIRDRNSPPSRQHWMGTTGSGSDLASNMIHATRIALSIGFISTGISVVIGVFVGGVMGYFSGWADLLGMRLVEIFSAIPTLLLLLCFVAVFEPNLYMMMVIIGLTGWDGYAIFTRAEFLTLRQRDFVQAAIAAGLPLRSILFRHMLPNGITPVVISASFGVASAIMVESTLSFLGIGLGVDEASWGKLLADARSDGGTFYWWLASFPGTAIFLTVFSYNLIGEAMRDELDPRLQLRE